MTTVYRKRRDFGPCLGSRRLPCIGALGKPVPKRDCTGTLEPVNPLDHLRDQVLSQEVSAAFHPGRVFGPTDGEHDNRVLGNDGGTRDNGIQNPCLYGGGNSSIVFRGAFDRRVGGPQPPNGPTMALVCLRGGCRDKFKRNRRVGNGPCGGGGRGVQDDGGAFANNDALPSTFGDRFTNINFLLGRNVGGACGCAGNPTCGNPIGGPGYTFM